MRPSLRDRPFGLHTDNASLQWLHQQRHVSHRQGRWLNLLADSQAEYHCRAVHTTGHTNPAPGSASPTGDDELDSELEVPTL